MEVHYISLILLKRITEHETGQIIKEIEPTKVRENIVTKETSKKSKNDT